LVDFQKLKKNSECIMGGDLGGRKEPQGENHPVKRATKEEKKKCGWH